MSKSLLIAAVVIFVSIGSLIGILTLDYYRSTKHWRSLEGCKEITGIELPDTIRIIDYQVTAFYSIADRANHKWLLESEDGFSAIDEQVSEFMLGGADDHELFDDLWPELDDQYGSTEVGTVIMGIGSGLETLFISSDNRYAILYAFRD